MPTWLNIAIWIILAIWSFAEVHGMYVLGTNPRAYYTKAASIVTWLWVLIMILWVSYSIFG